MEKLKTIQKREKLNKVYAKGEKGNGGAHHHYRVFKKKEENGPYVVNDIVGEIKFQNGARSESSSIHGILDSDLLEIVRHRLQCFQAGEFATRENAIALTHIEDALLWMNKRVEDRIEKKCIGNYE